MIQFFEEKGMHFVGHDIDGERMEVMELDGKISNFSRDCEKFKFGIGNTV